MSTAPYPYAALRDYAVREGGIRQRINPKLRDTIISWIVEDWPVGAREDELAEILMTRISGRLRKKYSSAVLAFILYIVASQLIQIAIEWVLERLENRQMMMQYHAKASGNL
jgi:hypothetical protein